MDGGLIPRPAPEPGGAPQGWLRTALAAAGVALLAGVILLLSYHMARQVGRSIKELRGIAVENRAVFVTARDVPGELAAAESAQRGLLLAPQAGYAQPFREAEAQVVHSLDVLALQSRSVVWLAPDAARLAEAARARMDGLEDGLRAGRAGQGDAEGRERMAAVDAIVARIAARAEADVQARTAEIATRERQADGTALGAVGLGVLLLVLATMGLLLGRRRLLQAQAQARTQADRLDSAISHIRDGVCVFDAQDRLLLWNEQFFAATGLASHLAVAGTSYADIVAGMGIWAPPLLDQPRPEVPGRPEAAEMRQEGRVLEVWRSLLPDGWQMVAVADITRREHAESTLRQAQKLDVLGQMTGGVAHDFNNLLQVISANLELIGARLPAGSPQEEWVRARLRAALSGVARGASLTRHLLAFARRQPLAPVAIDLSVLLGTARDLVARLLDATVRLEITVAPGLWPVLADPQQLENALLNLAANARDAMPGGGVLQVSARNAAPGALPGAGAGDYVELAVADTGTGMTKEQCARAVEPFYTTKPEGQGTGLGLSMVYGFAEQSGGHLRLDSAPGQGTTVRVWLPRARVGAQPARPVEPARTASPVKGRGELVLLVEDDAGVRAGAAGALRDLGYAVVEAEDAAEALLMLEHGTLPALLFSDVVLPGPLSAPALARRARALLPGLPVLFTSGYARDVLARDVLADDVPGGNVTGGNVPGGDAPAGEGEPGPAALLSKPWRIDELAERLRALLDPVRAVADGAAPARAARVLLAEDEPLIRTTAAVMLTGAGHAVLEAADGAAALVQAAQGIDVLVTDLGLPDMDGIALARRLRASIPDLPVVVVSGHPEEPGAAAEGIAWLQKPFDQARLRAVVAGALRRGH